MSNTSNVKDDGGICCFFVIYFVVIMISILTINLLKAPDWAYIIFAGVVWGLPICYVAHRINRWVKNRRNRPTYNERQREYEEYMRRQRQQGYDQQYQYQYYQQEQEEQQDSSAEYVGENPFDALGVRENASESEVKAAYRALSKKWHPDTYQTDDPRVKEMASEKFVKLQQAYERIKKDKGWK